MKLDQISEAYIGMILETKDNPLTDYSWAVHALPHAGEVSVKNPNGSVHSFHKTKPEAEAEAAKFNKHKGGFTYNVHPNKYKTK